MNFDLQHLTNWHQFSASVQWRLSLRGVLIGDSDVPETTSGFPQTVSRIWANHKMSIGLACGHYGVPVELIIATIATESRGKPNAERQEPDFVDYRSTPHRVSIGLMQTLISTAREALQNHLISADDLRDPLISVRAGTAYIALQRPKTGYDPPLVAAAYNSGGVYYQGGKKNRWRLKQYPIGTGKHVDRFVLYFNDCFRIFDPATAPSPSFIKALYDGGFQ